MSMENRDGWIWLDGQFIPWREATVHCMTHTLHYGCGAYEGIRAYPDTKGNVAVFRLAEHMQRLLNSTKILRMAQPYDKKTLCNAAIECIKRNNLQITQRSIYIRPMAFLSSETFGLNTRNAKTHIMVGAWEQAAYLGGDVLSQGIKVCTSSLRKHHPASTHCNAKANGHYVNSILANREAQDHGCVEALLLDHQGFIAEGAGENFFAVKDGVIYTPFTTSALNGITRQTIMQLAKDMGYTVIEQNLTLDFAYTADELFFTGTAAEVTPITILDNYHITDGKPGKITLELQARYFDCVHGKLPEYQHWLTPIN